MKTPATLEIRFDAPEAFALVVQHTLDGDRVTQTAALTAAAQIESDKLQTEFPTVKTT